jgi:hypothetical protein
MTSKPIVATLILLPENATQLFCLLMLWFSTTRFDAIGCTRRFWCSILRFAGEGAVSILKLLTKAFDQRDSLYASAFHSFSLISNSASWLTAQNPESCGLTKWPNPSALCHFVPLWAFIRHRTTYGKISSIHFAASQLIPVDWSL